ncbi:hypothetical protein RRG08_029259 [Elysia crispata]|uniref:Uncharacterized protein n=1 Tax=Elysia crispata TaxID=231223 RepID=A0AAE1AJG3_9GAST|nr:hypothetical protein RRG08_029259 [Elysia crispata]
MIGMEQNLAPDTGEVFELGVEMTNDSLDGESSQQLSTEQDRSTQPAGSSEQLRSISVDSSTQGTLLPNS